MTTTVPTVDGVLERLRAGYEHQDAAAMARLYSEDATWELHVGDAHVLLHGRGAIARRYAGDLAQRPTVLRWLERPVPWGAVVEAEAVQGSGAERVRFRWVHLLTLEDGRIVADTVYCTGAVPAPAPAGPRPRSPRPGPTAGGRGGSTTPDPSVPGGPATGGRS